MTILIERTFTRTIVLVSVGPPTVRRQERGDVMSVVEVTASGDRSRLAKLARAERALRQAEVKAGMRSETPAIQADFRPTPGPGAGGDPLEALGVDLLPGSAIGVAGSTALLLALVGAAGAGEKWTAIVGIPSLGVAAAAEFGIDLRRLVLVPEPGPQAAGVLAAIIDGFDVVAVGAGAVLRPGQRRSLLGRARTQRTAVFAPWREMPTRLEVEGTTWTGVGTGGGYLRQRELTVRRSGRGGERVVRVQLPSGAMPQRRQEGLRRVG